MSNTTAPIGNVVVIDTGLSASWGTGRLVYQYDFYHNDDSVLVSDANTHGAMVTAGVLKNAPDAGIIALKVMSDSGGATDETCIEKALQWVVANADAYNIVAVNLSLGGGAQTVVANTSMSDELAALAAKRVLTVAAGGNSGDGGATQSVSSFAADPNQICVSASTGDGDFPAWAQRSPTLTDICADGTDIRLTNSAGLTYSANGSSFAAPAVTAAVALAQQQAVSLTGARLTQDQFLSLAKASGTAMGTSGYFELNTDALLARIAQTHAPADPAPQPATSTITVNVAGSPAGGVNAHFNLLVDGKKIGEGIAGTTAKDYSFTANLSADQAHKIQVQYDNDAVVNGQDRSLFVNKVTVNGHAMAATDANVTYDKGALDGLDVVKGQSGLWWNGTLVFNTPASAFPAAPAAGSTITVNASGSPAGGVNAHFNLLVDGQKIGEGVAGTTAKDYAFTTNLTADQAHKVQIQYDNDTVINGQDRSLFVHEVTINGKAILPTDSIVSYDKGALDGKDVVKGQSGLWWNGTLVVDADKSYFPDASALADAGQQDVYQHLVTQGLDRLQGHTDDPAPMAFDLAAPALDLYAHADLLHDHSAG